MQMHGSVTNRIAERCSRALVPGVGMGATKLMYTDRVAYTVTRISASGKTFWMQRDKASRTDSNGMSESQSYAYEPDPEGEVLKVFRTKDGRWKSSGVYGCYVLLGERRAYHDYSF